MSDVRKDKLFTQMLMSTETVRIAVNASIANPRLQLPKHLMGQTHVAFDIGLSMPRPARFDYNSPEEISLGLDFGGRMETVVIPWACVFEMWDLSRKEGYAFPTSAPTAYAKAVDDAIEDFLKGLEEPASAPAPSEPKTENSNVIDFASRAAAIRAKRASKKATGLFRPQGPWAG